MNEIKIDKRKRPRTDEEKRRVSNTMKIKLASPEIRQKMSERAKLASIEKRQKHSEFMKRQWKDDKFKQVMKEKQKEVQNRPEVKLKRSESSKKMWENKSPEERKRKNVYYSPNIQREKKCGFCGSIFYRKDGNFLVQKFCSYECCYKSRKQGKFFNCFLCNKQFYASFSRLKVARYCSKSCKAKTEKNNQFKKGMISPFKGKPNSFIREKNISVWQDPIKRKKRIENIKNAMYKYNVRKKYLDAAEKNKELWKNKPYKDMRVGKMRRAAAIHPNKPEKLLDLLIQQHLPNEYLLNVKADTILNGKIPDWINCNGQKKVILFNGLYWHLTRFLKENPNLTKAGQEQKESKPYNELGYSVCFIWSDELKDTEKVLEKIREFNKAEVKHE